MKYLYSFEDGAVSQSDEKPTEEDMKMVEDGALYVVRVSSSLPIETCNTDGTWSITEDTKLENSSEGDYHYYC